ncbi:MAG TPA: cytochrome c [Acidobacteriaceae bacterium]|nr:cytochrome c [Acidobacteriaceae bacterium]
MKFLLGLVIGLLIVPIGIWIYLRAGSPPVATSDPALPFEEALVHIPLHVRIDREMVKTPPVEASPTNLQIGAHIYRQQCATCHGLYGLPASFAKGMYPKAPQLWEPHGNGVVGVSDDPPGETYWKVANGIRLSGMPAFKNVLNQTQMWQVSQLLANADKPLPPEVMTLLKQPLDLDPAAAQ